MSHTAIYRHFKDRDELFNEIAAIGFASMLTEQAANEVGRKSARDQLLAYGLIYLDFALRKPVRFSLMFGSVRSRHGRSFTATLCWQST